MCTVVILRRPSASWPVFIGANRDEMLSRAWDPPGAWWPDRPGVIGGRDRDAGGTWMAANAAGVVATVLNRPGSLGPAPGKRSRGKLPLLALEHGTASAAATAIAALPAAEWRPFNMVLADPMRAFFLRGTGSGRPEAFPLPEGVSMVTALDPNDLVQPANRAPPSPLPCRPAAGSRPRRLGRVGDPAGRRQLRRRARPRGSALRAAHRRLRHRLLQPARPQRERDAHLAVRQRRSLPHSVRDLAAARRGAAASLQSPMTRSTLRPRTTRVTATLRQALLEQLHRLVMAGHGLLLAVEERDHRGPARVPVAPHHVHAAEARRARDHGQGPLLHEGARVLRPRHVLEFADQHEERPTALARILLLALRQFVRDALARELLAPFGEEVLVAHYPLPGGVRLS